MKTQLFENDEAAFGELLIGHTVAKVSEREMVLDNGVRLRFPDTEGGCICGAGDYELSALNGVDNIITRVELLRDPSGDGYPDGAQGVYSIFVFAEDQRINLATWRGSDGNGYYGTGFTVHVIPAGAA